MQTKPKIKMIFFFSLAATSFLDFLLFFLNFEIWILNFFFNLQTVPGQENRGSEIKVGLTWRHSTDGVHEARGSDGRKLYLRVATRPYSDCPDFSGFQQIGGHLFIWGAWFLIRWLETEDLRLGGSGDAGGAWVKIWNFLRRVEARQCSEWTLVPAVRLISGWSTDLCDQFFKKMRFVLRDGFFFF